MYGLTHSCSSSPWSRCSGNSLAPSAVPNAKLPTHLTGSLTGKQTQGQARGALEKEKRMPTAAAGAAPGANRLGFRAGRKPSGNPDAQQPRVGPPPYGQPDREVGKFRRWAEAFLQQQPLEHMRRKCIVGPRAQCHTIDRLDDRETSSAADVGRPYRNAKPFPHSSSPWSRCATVIDGMIGSGQSRTNR